MSHFELHAHLKIRPGQLEGFKAQAAELIRITREQDTKTLRYCLGSELVRALRAEK